jgi:O-antigen ligase
MVNVLWTPIERIFGRGVEVSGLSAESPLVKGKVTDGARIADGDTIIEVNKKKIRTPESLLAEIEKNETSQVTYYRPDYNSIVEVKRADLLSGENALERLGVGSWKHSRIWRSAGFYSHYTTYSEVLQLIASLALGLFVALDKKRSRTGAFLIFCIFGFAFALLLTVTRGSQLGFLVSAFAIVLANGNRKMLLTLAAIVLPAALVGLVFLQQSRKVGFIDPKDDSTTWRETVWREGFNLWTESPRHFFLGVGMDSIQRYAKEWHLFDDGRLPMGHFHSQPLQLVVERGLPALLLWLWVLWIYARMLWRNLKFQIPDSENPKSKIQNPKSIDWQTKGIILGCFGGLIGFVTGGFVNNNIGNAVVMMIFFLLMGLSVSLVMQNSKLEMQKV